MPLDTLLQWLAALPALVAGGPGQAAAILDNPRFLLVSFTLALISIAVALVRQRRLVSGFFSLALAAGLGWHYVDGSLRAFDHHMDRVLMGARPAAMQSGSAGTLHACEARCGASDRCLAFTFDAVAKTCSLLPEITRMHRLPGAISGIRRGERLDPTTRGLGASR